MHRNPDNLSTSLVLFFEPQYRIWVARRLLASGQSVADTAALEWHRGSEPYQKREWVEIEGGGEAT